MKNSKKFIACLLVAAMFVSNTFLSELSPFVMKAHAAWDGTVAESFSSGDGTEESPYIIENEGEFAYFGSLLSQGINFEGEYLELNNDINITGYTWAAGSSAFNGNLYGNGHTITLDKKLLGTIGINGKIEFLNIKNISTALCCILCGGNKGIIENCGIFSQVDSDEVYKNGLVCEYNSGKFINSYVIGRAAGYNSYIAAIASENRGTIDNVYTSVSNGITQGGKYAGSDYDPIVLSNTGTITNAYSSYGSSAYSTSVTVANMKTQDFVDTLNKMNPSNNTAWAMDTDNKNEGFPIIIKDEKSTIECYLEYSSESKFIYHTEELNTQILPSEDIMCDIYYTLDGSDPTTSDTAQLYDGQGITITGDVVLSMVACEDGRYGKITTQDIICILGEGTEEDPYQIDSKKDLCSVYMEPSANYLLVKDLEFTAGDYNAGGICPSGWQPISEFSGVFDGAGHKISYLKGAQGGFVNKNNGTITNVRFLNHQLTYNSSGEYFGTVANINNGQITKCYVDIQHSTGYVKKYAGGIAGYNSGTIAYCQTQGKLKLRCLDKYLWLWVGGIAGLGGNIYNCYNNAEISVLGNYTDRVEAGGICGEGNVYDCRNDGKINVDITLSYWLYISAFSTSTAKRCYGDLNYTTTSTNITSKIVQEYTYAGCYSSSEFNNIDKFREETYVGFDFENTWMITASGPMPQGIMNADGNCYSKTNYVAPTCVDEGTLAYKNQSDENFSEKIPATGHLAGTAVCQGMEVCSICDKLIPNEENPEGKNHDYAETWMSNETYHWKECQSEGCESIGEKAEHSGGTATPLAQAVCSVCGTPYGELDETIATYNVTANALNIDSLESITAKLSGAGTYIDGDVVTVSAPEKLGMKFMGWYGASDAVLCKELQYSFEIKEDTELVAMYRVVGTGKLRVFGAGFKVNDGVTQSIYNYTKTFTIGEKVTLTATGDNFAYWVNETNKIVTEQRSHTFTIAGDVTFIPVYKNATEGTAYVEFISDYGQIIQAQNYSSTSEIELPGAVNKTGYRFVSWSMTGDEIANAIAEGKVYIRVTPVYEALPDVFTVTIIYDGNENDAEVVIGYAGYQFMEVVAQNIEGRTFSHWSDSQSGENVLSTSETYSVYINKNTTVYAIYVDEGVEVQQISTMVTNDISTKILDEATKSIVVLATRDVIAGYTIVEHGILYSANSDYGKEGSGDTMVVGASGVARGISNSKATDGAYAHTITLTEEQLDIIVYARGYMILADEEGNLTTVYGAILSGSYNSLSH